MATSSGVTVVTTAGSAVQLGSQVINGAVLVKAQAGNSGLVYDGNVDGDVAAANGYELAAGQEIRFEFVGDLASIWVDAAVNGEGVCWAALWI